MLRVKQAAQELGIAPVTVRKWCNEGKLQYELNAAKQRVFDKEYLQNFKRQQLGEPEPLPITIFYVRSSSGNDVTIQTQIDKLTLNYGEPTKIFHDKSSGLNDKRPGLTALIDYLKNNSHNKTTVYITNKDRLTRFGYHYLEELFATQNTTIKVLEDDECKEPQEILMQDFMILIASFSGKFYRLRGWTQHKQFLNKAQEEVMKHEQK